jgi:hypothetical protein
MSCLRKFAYKFSGLDKSGSSFNLPSRSNQLKYMGAPLICQLWKENIQKSIKLIVLYHSLPIVAHCFLLKTLQAITGVDCDCPTSVYATIPSTWWSEHNFCNYMLACPVHKDNKDISMRATELPAGRK